MGLRKSKQKVCEKEDSKKKKTDTKSEETNPVGDAEEETKKNEDDKDGQEKWIDDTPREETTTEEKSDDKKEEGKELSEESQKTIEAQEQVGGDTKFAHELTETIQSLVTENSAGKSIKPTGGDGEGNSNAQEHNNCGKTSNISSSEESYNKLNEHPPTTELNGSGEVNVIAIQPTSNEE